MNINWREAPLVRLVLFFSLGIGAAIYTDTAPSWWLPVFLLALLCGLVVSTSTRIDYKFRWIFGVMLSVWLFGFGFLRTCIYKETNKATHYTHFLDTTAQQVVGIVADAPRFRNKTMLLLSIESIGYPTKMQAADGQLLAYLVADSASAAIKYGDRVIMQAAILPHLPNGNPEAFDFGRYLRLQNIHYTCFVDSSAWEVVGHDLGNPIKAVSLRYRDHFLALLEKHLPNRDVFGVGSALLLGFKDGLSDEVQQSYVETGSMHILAVSGMHVGLIYGGIVWLFKAFGLRGRKWKYWEVAISLIAAWSFALITGMGASILRAAVMFTFLAVGRAAKRYINIYNILAASAFSILLYNPYLLADVGFQLSYLAVVGIVMFQKKLYLLINIDNWLGDKAWELTAVGIAAQISTLPISLLYFHQFPNYFWLSGLLAIPASSVGVYAGVLLFISDAIWQPLAVFFGWITYGCVWIMNAAIKFVQQLPAALIQGIWIEWPSVLLLYGAIYCLFRQMSRQEVRNVKWAIAALGFTALVLSLNVWHYYQTSQQQHITIYQTKKAPIIDCFDGNTVLSISDNNYTDKQLRNITQNHRWANGMRVQDTVSLHGVYNKGNCSFSGNVLVFGGVTIGIIGDSLAPSLPDKPFDYLVLSGKLPLTMSEITAQWPSKQVLIDNSCPRWLAKKWAEDCAQLKVLCHDIKNEGAYVIHLPLNKN